MCTLLQTWSNSSTLWRIWKRNSSTTGKQNPPPSSLVGKQCWINTYKMYHQDTQEISISNFQTERWLQDISAALQMRMHGDLKCAKTLISVKKAICQDMYLTKKPRNPGNALDKKKTSLSSAKVHFHSFGKKGLCVIFQSKLLTPSVLSTAIVTVDTCLC